MKALLTIDNSSVYIILSLKDKCSTMKQAAALRIILCSVFFMFFLFSISQTGRIDSLKKQIILSRDKKQQLDLLLALCNERNSLNSDTLNTYASAAKALAIELNDQRKSSWADFYLAFRILTKGMTDSSLQMANRQLTKTYNTVDDKELFVKFYLLKANALNRSNKTKEALDILYQLLAEAEKAGDGYTELYVCNYIGTAYQILSQSKEAQKWFYRAVRIPQALTSFKYQEAYASSLLNLGITYMSLYQENFIKALSDSCETYLTKAISLSKANQYLGTIAYASNMKGLILSYTHQNKAAEIFLKEGLHIRKQIGDPYYIISDIIALGEFYLNTGQPQKGIQICTEGIALAQQYHVTADLAGLYNTAAENYKALGDMVQYGEILKQLIVLKDSVYRKNSADQLAEMQTRYDVQKKENTIIQQNYDLAKKNYFLYGAFGLLVATLLIAYILFQNKKKNQRLKLIAWEAQQKKKTTEAIMQAEEDERKRIAQDLHDSVAQKMVVAKMNLESLRNKIEHLNLSEQKIYNDISSLLEESSTEVRSLSHSMMPRAFSHSGLTDAIREFLDKIDHSVIQVFYNAEGDFTRIGENVSLMIYRVMQELVQNVLKHAKAKILDIAMIADENAIDITIEDDGVGFEANGDHEEGTGFKNIQSRVAYLDGTIDINSQLGVGTVIALFIPIIKNKTHQAS